MRLIDVDKLIKFIRENGYVYANTLESFPKINITYCKDCNFASLPEMGQVACFKHKEIFPVDGFCHSGQPKEAHDET